MLNKSSYSVKNFFQISYFLYLFPFALVTGPVLTEICCNIIGINFLYKSIKYKLKKYYLNKFVYLFLLFYFYLITRSIFSEDPSFSLHSSLFYFRYLLFSLGVWYILDTQPNSKNNFGKFLIITISLVLLGLFAEYIFSKSLFGYDNLIDGRLYSLFGDEPIVGSYLSRLAPFAYYFAIFSGLLDLKKNRNKFFLFFFFALLNLGIFLSGERTAFVFSMMIFLIIIFLTKEFFKIKLVISLLSVFLIIFSLNFDNKIKSRMIDFTKSQLTGVAEKIDEKSDKFKNIDKKLYDIGSKRKANSSNFPGFGEYYSALYYSAYLMFEDNILFGQGPRMFRKLCGTDKFYVFGGCSTHPHNTYMQLLSELGLVGFVFIFSLFLTIFILFALHFIKKTLTFINKQNKYNFLSDELICYYAAIFITLFPLSPNGNFFNNWLNFIYYMPVGFIMFYFSKKKLNE